MHASDTVTNSQLQQLATREMDIYEAVQKLSNGISTSQVHLQPHYDAYRVIHERYTVLADHSDEALKRGLFLQWYALVEPPSYTGINAIMPEAEEKIFQLLNRRIGQRTLDEEGQWMWQCYADFGVFETQAAAQPVLASSKNIRQDDALLQQKINQAIMTNRGQMGLYWASRKRQ